MPKELIYGRTVTVRRGDLLDPTPQAAPEPASEPPAAAPTPGPQLSPQLNVEALAACHLQVVRERDELRRNAAELELLRAFAAWLGPHLALASAPLDPTDPADRTAAATLEPIEVHYARLVDELALARTAASSEPTAADDPADDDDPDTDDDNTDDDPQPSKLAQVAAQPRRFRRADDDAADAADSYLDALAEVRVRPALELTWLRDGANLTARVAYLDELTGAPVTPRAPLALDLDWTAANRAIRKFRVARDQANGTPE